MSKMKIWIVIFLIGNGLNGFAQMDTSPSDHDEMQGYKLVYHQDFESPQGLLDFEMTDANAWRIDRSDDNSTVSLFGASEYESRIRSPFNIAVMNRLKLGDFIMEVDLAQTGREYDHRDLCLFFGIQSPTNFYYVHIAPVADQYANNIFIVNDEPRIAISTRTTAGTDWGKQGSWHKVRIVRSVSEGTIEIYFDDMTTPIMEASDTHFLSGHVGLGSFDDTGDFDNLKIWAPEVMPLDSQKFFRK